MSKHELSDEMLVCGVASGDESCIDLVVARYQDVVFGLATHLTHSEADAREVVEEVFVRLYREASSHTSRTLESLIHEFAYDASLSRLIGSVDNHLSQTRELCCPNGAVYVEVDNPQAYTEIECTEVQPVEIVQERLEQAVDLMGHAARTLSEVDE